MYILSEEQKYNCNNDVSKKVGNTWLCGIAWKTATYLEDITRWCEDMNFIL